jgi:hypothetical protein
LFFQLEYDVPSLIGKYAVDTGLIGLERLKSFLFDLNQGLAPNLPGVILGVVVLLVLQKPTLDLALRSFAVLCAVLAMATPTLAAPNWNSGSIVIMRYAYWAAMPLVALLLELAASVAWRRAALVLCLFAAGQLAVLATNGLRGEDASYLRHGWLARTVLARAPSAYEPVTEVFVERTLGREAGLREDQALAWPRHGWPKKVLVHESIKFAPAMDCPAGTEPMPSSLSRLSGGWEYQNGPFRCGVPAARP